MSDYSRLLFFSLLIISPALIICGNEQQPPKRQNHPSPDHHPITTKKNQTKPTSSNPIKIPSSSSSSSSQGLPKKQIEDDDDEYDLVSEFRDLPSKFQETIVPDFSRISETSKAYLDRYNREFTRGFKPYVGSKYASTFASYALFAFIIIPLIIVSFLFNRINAYLSIHKILIFVHIYLAIYFVILAFSCLLTGLEPLRFFYATSRSTYLCVQLLQTLAYVLYLLLLLMYLILVFSTHTGLPTKMLGLGQTFVGFAVGLHYYMTVFHRAVLHQPPKSTWKVHGIYATCFGVICFLSGLGTTKKAYSQVGGEEGKNS